MLLPFLRVLRVLRGSLFSLLLVAAAQAAPYAEPVHGDFVIRDFRFVSGEVLPELKLHYFTLDSEVAE